MTTPPIEVLDAFRAAMGHSWNHPYQDQRWECLCGASGGKEHHPNDEDDPTLSAWRHLDEMKLAALSAAGIRFGHYTHDANGDCCHSAAYRFQPCSGVFVEVSPAAPNPQPAKED